MNGRRLAAEMRRRMVGALLIVLTAGAAIPAQAGDAAAELSIRRITPVGADVPAANQIVIEFSRAVVPLGRMERDASELPITIAPALNCKWRWINRQALACNLDDQDRMAEATRYRIAVNPGIAAMDGATIDEAVRREFVTVRPGITRVLFKTWKHPGVPVVRLVFNQPVSKTSVADHVKLAIAGRGRRDPTNSSEFKCNLPGYTMGDAGAAALFTIADNDTGIFYRNFSAVSEHWDLTTVSGGGSMHPRGDEHTYIRADGPRLKVAFRDTGLPFLQRVMREADVRFTDFRRIFVHQVSLPYLHDMLSESGIPLDLVEVTIADLGNVAAASIPVAMARAFERGAIGPGDRVMCLGLASGISIGIVMIDL